MKTLTLIYIILALLISVAIAFFQYFFKEKRQSKIHMFLFILKTLSLFFIGLLLINPKIKNTKITDVKPVLSLLIDNSFSVKHFKEANNIKRFVNDIEQHKELNKKFDVNFFTFGKNTQILDSLSFNKTETDIDKAIKSVNNLYKDKLGTMILFSDGNQTIGNDYEFTNSKQTISTLVIGDTTKYVDVKISQLNANKYSYIKNKFPVEVLLFYDGKTPIKTEFSITKNGKKVFSKPVSFTADKNTTTITAELTSTKKGLHYYTAGISTLKKEKNTKNNYKKFSVEVINEQTSVLILSSILHPDLGMLKRSIESNKQRKVTIKLITKSKQNIDDYQLVIFYQPTYHFKNIIAQRKSNYLLITGTKTNWNFINLQEIGIHKKAIEQTENYTASYNTNFLTFLQKDIHFNKFPPLQDKFGEVAMTTEHQPLLYQKMANVITNQPLIATLEKKAFILGEGIWRWRSQSFLENKSFEKFDTFIGSLVQYLASTKKRNRLEVKAKRLYPANSSIIISALYVDKNYNFDNRASLQITITNQDTQQKNTFPMSLVGGSYQTDVEGLSAGNYAYKVTVEGQNINTYGRFEIESYQVEEQFANANIEKLQKLVNRTGGKLFFKNEKEKLLGNLLGDKQYFTSQKLEVSQESLIHWKYLLLIIAGLLAVEWFTRKYYGKI